MAAGELDVMICGGGVAGLSLALHLVRARPGIRVAVVDGGALPASPELLKVGESTSEVSAWYLAERLGLEAMLREEHILKLGLRLFYADPDRGGLASRVEFGVLTPREGDFNVPFQGLNPPTFQLHRGRLEHALALLCAEEGVQLLAGWRVGSLVRGLPHRVSLHQDGAEDAWSARWVVDATGAGLSEVGWRSLGAPVWARATWVTGRVDVEGWTGDPGFAARIPPGLRWRSTNHLMGAGYWIWLIPLKGEVMSVGVVMDPAQHDPAALRSNEGLRAWLMQHEPELASVLPAGEIVGGLLKVEPAVRSELLTEDRVAHTGAAALRLDPLYSPGLDMMAMAHELLVPAILADLDGGPWTAARRHATLMFDELATHFGQTYRSLYRVTGHPKVMAAKVVWDLAIYFGFVALLARSGRLGDPALVQRIGQEARRVATLQARVQGLWEVWAAREPAEAVAGFIDQGRSELLIELHQALRDRGGQELLLRQLDRSLVLLERLAVALFRRAVLEPPPPEVGINPYAIGPDPMRWERDGLFSGRWQVRLSGAQAADLEAIWLGEVPALAAPDGATAWLSRARFYACVGEGPARAQCLRVVNAFLVGVQQAERSVEHVVRRVRAEVREGRGFVWEGVGLGEVLRDGEVRAELLEALLPHERTFLAIGVGWSARLRGEELEVLDGQEPSASDGYGFCSGLVFPKQTWARRGPAGSEALRWWHDHGLGRSLWFLHAGRASAIARAVQAMDAARREALWTGVGVASAFTGGVPEEELARLVDKAEDGRPALAVGVRSGVGLHAAEGTCPPWAELAGRVAGGMG